MRRWQILAALMLGAACVPQPANAEGEALRIGTAAPVASLDPDSGPDPAWVTPGNAMYDGLLAYAADGRTVTGRLASSWTVSPDGLTMTLTLRGGVRFHDGTVMTSADVKASLQRRMAAGGPLAARLTGVAAIATPQSGTVVLTLAQPMSWLPDVLAGAWGPKIVSSTALQAHDQGDGARGWLATHEAGTGPYRLAEFAPEHVRLERAGGGWLPAPAYAAVDLVAVGDTAARLLQLHASALDIALNALPAPALDRLPPDLSVTVLQGTNIVVGMVNPVGLLSDQDARQAALAALNPKTWLSAATNKTASAPRTVFPHMVMSTLDPPELPEDFQVARQLVRRLRSAELRLGYPADQADLLRGPMELVQANLANLGFDVTLTAIPPAATARFGDDPANAPDLWIVCATPGETTPQALARWLYVTDAPGNVFGLIDPTATRLAQQADAQSDRRAMLRQYQLLSNRLFDRGNFIPLADLPAIVAHRAGIGGVAAPPGFPPGAIDLAALRQTP